MSRRPRAGQAGRPVTVKATEAERAAWQAAAEHAGVDLSTWLRRAADDMALAGRWHRPGWLRPSRPDQ